MAKEIQGPEDVQPEMNLSEAGPGARALKLSRRDFLKVAGVGALAFMEACSTIGPIVTSTPQGSAETAPTLDSKDIMAGMGEFVSGDPALAESLNKLLSENFNLKIPPEAVAPFSVTVGGAKFDFVSLAPLENKELEISWDEKIFMKVEDTLADLDRKVVTIDNRDMVVWSFINSDGTPEPTLWHPLLTNEQWSSMTPEQKRDLYAGFAPPTQLEGEIPGFLRSSDQIFAISFMGLPDGAFKVFAALAPVVTPEPTETPEIKQFKVCSPEQFRDCPVAVEDLFNGDYLKWLYTLSKPFDQTRIRTDVPLVNYHSSDGSFGQIRYPTETAPHFQAEGTEPFRRDVSAGYTIYAGHNYIVMPIEYFDLNNPDQNQWVITVHPLYNDTHEYSPEEAQHLIEVWRTKMNITPINSTTTPEFSTRPDPLASKSFAEHPDMAELIDSFVNHNNFKPGGDMFALSKPGIILLNTIATIKSGPQVYK